MSNDPQFAARSDTETTATCGAERRIGSYGTRGDGSLLVLVAGIHGNEPAGVEAARRVFECLDRDKPQAIGRVMAFVGNVTALQRGVRFVDSDLNRMWQLGRVAELGDEDPARRTVEQEEQLKLLRCVQEEIDAARGPVVVIDLHSTSAEAAPFSIISDTLQNRHIAFGWRLPVILGLEERIEGTIQSFFGDRGYITAAIEGGQHRNTHTVDYLESALWVVLAKTNILGDEDVPDLPTHERRLRSVAGRPIVVEVVHRHGTAVGDEFVMHPGFENFDSVLRDQVVARDAAGDIRSPADGLLVMPNYQNIGDDGFFVGRRVRRFWLRLSTVFRKLRVDRLLPVLPGVRRHPTSARTLLVNPAVARYLLLQIFHLCGFRRCPPEGNSLVFCRRPEGPRD